MTFARTIDVPELSSIRADETLTAWRRRVAPVKPSIVRAILRVLHH